MQKKTNTISINLLLVLLLVLGVTFGAFNNTVNYIFLYLIMPIVFIYCFFTSQNTFKNYYVKVFLILVIWSCISTVIKSENFDYSYNVLTSMIMTLMFCFSMIALAKKNERNITLFYLLILSFYIVNWYYAIFHFDLLSANISLVVFDEQSLIYEKINANRWGYFTLFLTFATFIYGELAQSNKWRRNYRIIFLMFLLVVFFNALYTGSRQVLILNIPLYFILLFYRYKKTIFSPKIIIRIVVIIIFVIMLGQRIKTTYEISSIKNRFDSTILKEDARFHLMTKAFNYGIENPIFGIGPGNMEFRENVISHCSYSEIFAETGIFGLFLYMLIIFGCYLEQIKRYRETQDKVFLYFSIYTLFYALNNFFYVFYSWYLLMSILFLITAHSDLYYEKKYPKAILKSGL